MKMFILNVNEEKRTATLYKDGVKITCVLSEDLNPHTIPLNGVGMVEQFEGVNYLISCKETNPFAGLLEVARG